MTAAVHEDSHGICCGGLRHGAFYSLKNEDVPPRYRSVPVKIAGVTVMIFAHETRGDVEVRNWARRRMIRGLLGR